MISPKWQMDLDISNPWLGFEVSLGEVDAGTLNGYAKLLDLLVGKAIDPDTTDGDIEMDHAIPGRLDRGDADKGGFALQLIGIAQSLRRLPTEQDHRCLLNDATFIHRCAALRVDTYRDIVHRIIYGMISVHLHDFKIRLPNDNFIGGDLLLRLEAEFLL